LIILAYNLGAIAYSKEKYKVLLKYAQDGHWTWRVLASISALLIILSNLLGLLSNFFGLSPIDAMLNIYLLIFGSLMLALEYK
jgi:hypothetical protein